MKARRSPQPTIAFDAPMIGASSPAVPGSSTLVPAGFLAKTTFDVPEPTAFTLTPPRLSVDGESITLPEIRFTRRRHHYVLAPINC